LRRLAAARALLGKAAPNAASGLDMADSLLMGRTREVQAWAPEQAAAV
jgi:hypothetical protein